MTNFFFCGRNTYCSTLSKWCLNEWLMNAVKLLSLFTCFWDNSENLSVIVGKKKNHNKDWFQWIFNRTLLSKDDAIEKITFYSSNRIIMVENINCSFSNFVMQIRTALKWTKLTIKKSITAFLLHESQPDLYFIFVLNLMDTLKKRESWSYVESENPSDIDFIWKHT